MINTTDSSRFAPLPSDMKDAVFATPPDSIFLLEPRTGFQKQSNRLSFVERFKWKESGAKKLKCAGVTVKFREESQKKEIQVEKNLGKKGNLAIKRRK